MDNNKRIVVALDGSSPSLRALALAADLARARDLVMELCHVVDLAPAELGEGVAPPWFGAVQEALERGAEEIVAEAAARLGADLRQQRRLLAGPVRQALLEHITAEPPALLVVGRTGKGGVERLLTGSTSIAMATHCPCPVIIVP